MREHTKENCNINDQVHDTPPQHDCGHNVMEGPGINPDGTVKPNPNGQTIRKDRGRFGPGIKDERQSQRQTARLSARILLPVDLE